MRTIETKGVPIHVWARSLAEDTTLQLTRLAESSFVASHVAAMADAHVSDGVAVGTVFATRDHIVPAAIGGDLGCGVSAVRLSLDAERLDDRTREHILGALDQGIPSGKGLHRGAGSPLPDGLASRPLSTGRLEHEKKSLGPRCMGTLGGGNHFLELDRDADGRVWLLVHSGSRGLGACIMQHHVRAAVARRGELGTIDARGPAGAGYLDDLAWALDFARANRRAMVARALLILEDQFGAVEAEEVVDLHHNFIREETWGGEALFVHRKGAVAAPVGELAIVPGSMGTATYLVEGLGHPLAFGSCSHGAGRVMTRKEARGRVRRDALAHAMRRITYPTHRAASLVEESPEVYRDIGEVLEDQVDLVMKGARLEPLLVLKG